MTCVAAPLSTRTLIPHHTLQKEKEMGVYGRILQLQEIHSQAIIWVTAPLGRSPVRRYSCVTLYPRLTLPGYATAPAVTHIIE